MIDARHSCIKCPDSRPGNSDGDKRLTTNMSLADLPEDIILMILPLLNPKDFLSLCSVNRDFYSSFHLEPTYWRVQTSTTFRIPINPLLLAEGGARWYWLYKKLRTQTVAYAWGSDSHGSLGQEGHRPEPPTGLGARPLIRHRPIIRSIFSCPEPKEMHVPTDVGVIADLQSGGWSTSLLSSKGEIWSVGVLDAADGRMLGKPVSYFTKLEYGHLPDEGYPSIETFEPIKQFSSGRRHLLGLDEAGNIWFWNQFLERGRKIEFLSPDLIGGKKAIRVVAGWQDSTAFVPGQGIVHWRPPDGGDENPFPAINEKIVPHTGYASNDSKKAGDDEDHSEYVGQVLAHIVLENYIVYITSTSRVFAFKIDVSELPIEVTSLSSPSTGYGPLLNIQGSFRRFAVFSSTGQVLTCDQDYLENWLRSLNNHLTSHSTDLDPPHHLQSHNLLPAPPLIPALQNIQVISLAFGDYHFHALHSTGDISSYGHEPGHSGAFGLNSNDCHVALLRGLIPPSRNPRYGRGGGGSRLSAQAWRSPRRIWFDRERQDWIKELAEKAGSKGWTNDVNHQALPVAGDNAAQQEFPAPGLSEEEWAGISEWVEQEGLAWYTPNNKTESSQQPLPHRPDPSKHTTATITENIETKPFFAITVSAAGWHSSALVLRDEPAAIEKEKEAAGGSTTQNPTNTPRFFPATTTSSSEDDKNGEARFQHLPGSSFLPSTAPQFRPMPREFPAPSSTAHFRPMPGAFPAPSSTAQFRPMPGSFPGPSTAPPPPPPPTQPESERREVRDRHGNPGARLPTLRLPDGRVVRGDGNGEEEESEWAFGMPERLFGSEDGEFN